MPYDNIESIRNFAEENSLFNHFMVELRSIKLQNDKMRFRRNLERLSEIMAYEISKTLSYIEEEIDTPLGTIGCKKLNEEIVIASILRAGLPMHQGFLNYFDNAENAFISAFRKYHKDGTFDIKFEYLSAPSIENKILILTDPMLATGSSMAIAYKGLINNGIPKYTFITSLVSSKEGIDYLRKNIIQNNYSLWVGAVDDELTAKGYIVPGLGDAGDLAYGSKS